MALELKISFVEGKTVLIAKNVTGDYDAADNPGGYGSPNEAFDDFAHYMIIRKKNVNNVNDVVLDVVATDPLEATEFQINRAVDGWYSATALDIKIWADDQSIEIGDVRYYGGLIYEALTNNLDSQPNVNPSDWVARTILEVESNTDVISATSDTVVYYNADVYYSKHIADNSIKGKCGVCEDERKKIQYEQIEFHLNAAAVANCQKNYADGEWNVLALIKLSAK